MCEGAFLGVFFPHRDINKTSSLASEHPKLALRSGPQRFSRSRRFSPLLALRVCFTPLPRPGFTFQGFVPAAQPRLPRRQPSALLSLCDPRLPLVAELLQLGRPAFRALFRAAIRRGRRSV